MNILWITPTLPEPIDSGGKIVTFRTVESLAKMNHKIGMYPLTGGISSRRLPKFLELYPPPYAHNTKNSLFRAGVNLFSDKPYIVRKYWDEGLWTGVNRVLQTACWDVVHCDHLHTAEYGLQAKRLYGVPIILGCHNVESTLWKQTAQLQRNPAKRIYCRIESKKIASYESSVVSVFDRCITLSDEDARQLRKLSPAARIDVVPPGVESKYYTPKRQSEQPGCITFVGRLDWPPNIDGVLWFLRHVWPIIRRALPHAQFHVVGAHPPSYVQQLDKDKNVTVTGWVEDVRPYIDRSQVVVVPTRVRSGVRIKILNALAMEKAVVTTSAGCEGLKLNHQEHILVANSAQDFAASVIQLIQDNRRRQQLKVAGSSLVQNEYNWNKTANAVSDVYLRATENHRNERL